MVDENARTFKRAGHIKTDSLLSVFMDTTGIEG